MNNQFLSVLTHFFPLLATTFFAGPLATDLVTLAAGFLAGFGTGAYFLTTGSDIFLAGLANTFLAAGFFGAF
jgi:hypothetical protein